MAIIGLLLLAAAGTVAIDLAVENRQALDVDAFGSTYSTTPAGMLVAGMVLTLLAIVGVLVLAAGLKARRRKAQERHAAIDERDSLEAELEAERRARQQAEAKERAAVAAVRARERDAAHKASERPIDLRDSANQGDHVSH